jgi:hypothetical protein
VSDDFVGATASDNRELLELAARVRVAAEAALRSRDTGELIAALRETVELLDAVVIDLTGNRAEGAAVYATDPEFRRPVDEISQGGTSSVGGV